MDRDKKSKDTFVPPEIQKYSVAASRKAVWYYYFDRVNFSH